MTGQMHLNIEFFVNKWTWAILIAFWYLFGWRKMRTVEESWPDSNRYSLLRWSAALYIVGKLLSVYALGPQMIRSYLADIFFIPGISWHLIIIAENRETPSHYIPCIIDIVSLAAVSYEFMQLAKISWFPGVEVAGGDWVDLAIFAVTWLLTRVYVTAKHCETRKTFTVEETES